MFTAPYPLSPYRKLKRLVFKRLICLSNYFFFLGKMNLSRESRHLCLLRTVIR